MGCRLGRLGIVVGTGIRVSILISMARAMLILQSYSLIQDS